MILLYNRYIYYSDTTQYLQVVFQYYSLMNNSNCKIELIF